jgi:hypothetical protein
MHTVFLYDVYKIKQRHSDVTVGYTEALDNNEHIQVYLLCHFMILQQVQKLYSAE